MKNLLLSIILISIVSCKNQENKVETTNIGHFKFIISDTLTYGMNLARISEYSRELKENERSVITVIIKNELEKGNTKIDTFSDGLKTPFFGINRYQTGKQKIEIKVEEKMMRTKKLPNDSLSLEIKDIYYTYEFDVFIKGKGYKSKLNEMLSKQMEIEYKENPN